MRLELAHHVLASGLNAFRMLQDVVDTQDLHAAPIHGAGGASPNLKGCVDSPEASTVILMVVGTLGLYYGSALFLRIMRRRALQPGV